MVCRFLSLLILTSFLSSCYDRIEGCLDVKASNYNPASDDACEDCCTFPNVNFILHHLLSDKQFRTDTIIRNDLGQEFRIIDSRFYISEVKLHTEELDVRILETIETVEGQIFPNDIKIVRNVDNKVTIGTTNVAGTISNLLFTIGIPATITQQTFINLPTTHPLLPTVALLNQQNELLLLQISLARQEKNDTIKIDILNEDPVSSIAISQEKFAGKGKDIDYQIILDYTQLFKNIDIYGDIPIIQNQLKNNFTSNFFVK